ASIIGLHWLILPATIVTLFGIAKVVERRNPNNWLHFFVQLPILSVGSIWFIDVVLILLLGGRLHGIPLILLTVAVPYTLIMNFLILRHLNIDFIIKSMAEKGLVTASKESIYFLMPDKLGIDAGLP